MLREKARWELYNDTMHYFEQIMEAAPKITGAVWPLTSHLTNHPCRTRYAVHCLRMKDKLRRNVFLWTPTHGHTSVDWPTNKNLYTSAMCGH